MDDNQTDIENKILKISKKHSIHTYFYEHSASEVNNLKGASNIFLNINQPVQEIWNDFNELIHFIYNA